MAKANTYQPPTQRLRVNFIPSSLLGNVKAGDVFFGHLSRSHKGLSGRVLTGAYFVRDSDQTFLVNPAGSSTVYRVLADNYRPVNNPGSKVPIFEMDSPQLSFLELEEKDPIREGALKSISGIRRSAVHNSWVNYSTMLKNPRVSDGKY